MGRNLFLKVYLTFLLGGAIPNSTTYLFAYGYTHLESEFKTLVSEVQEIAGNVDRTPDEVERAIVLKFWKQRERIFFKETRPNADGTVPTTYDEAFKVAGESRRNYNDALQKVSRFKFKSRERGALPRLSDSIHHALLFENVGQNDQREILLARLFSGPQLARVKKLDKFGQDLYLHYLDLSRVFNFRVSGIEDSALLLFEGDVGGGTEKFKFLNSNYLALRENPTEGTTWIGKVNYFELADAVFKSKKSAQLQELLDFGKTLEQSRFLHGRIKWLEASKDDQTLRPRMEYIKNLAKEITDWRVAKGVADVIEYLGDPDPVQPSDAQIHIFLRAALYLKTSIAPMTDHTVLDPGQRLAECLEDTRLTGAPMEEMEIISRLEGHSVESDAYLSLRNRLENLERFFSDIPSYRAFADFQKKGKAEPGLEMKQLLLDIQNLNFDVTAGERFRLNRMYIKALSHYIKLLTQVGETKINLEHKWQPPSNQLATEWLAIAVRQDRALTPPSWDPMAGYPIKMTKDSPITLLPFDGHEGLSLGQITTYLDLLNTDNFAFILPEIQSNAQAQAMKHLVRWYLEDKHSFRQRSNDSVAQELAGYQLASVLRRINANNMDALASLSERYLPSFEKIKTVALLKNSSANPPAAAFSFLAELIDVLPQISSVLQSQAIAAALQMEEAGFSTHADPELLKNRLHFYIKKLAEVRSLFQLRALQALFEKSPLWKVADPSLTSVNNEAPHLSVLELFIDVALKVDNDQRLAAFTVEVNEGFRRKQFITAEYLDKKIGLIDPVVPNIHSSSSEPILKLPENFRNEMNYESIRERIFGLRDTLKKAHPTMNEETYAQLQIEWAKQILMIRGLLNFIQPATEARRILTKLLEDALADAEKRKVQIDANSPQKNSLDPTLANLLMASRLDSTEVVKYLISFCSPSANRMNDFEIHRVDFRIFNLLNAVEAIDQFVEVRTAVVVPPTADLNPKVETPILVSTSAVKRPKLGLSDLNKNEVQQKQASARDRLRNLREAKDSSDSGINPTEEIAHSRILIKACQHSLTSRIENSNGGTSDPKKIAAD